MRQPDAGIGWHLPQRRSAKASRFFVVAFSIESIERASPIWTKKRDIAALGGGVRTDVTQPDMEQLE